jgi:Tfp pilus assembly protein PilF
MHVLWGVGLAVLIAAGALGSGPLTPDSSPSALIDRYSPEPLGSLRVPAYLTGRDRAVAEVQAGLYRRALYTLSGTTRPAPPLDVAGALVASAAHEALGEFDEAATVLDPFAADLGVEIRRAELLRERGRNAEAMAGVRAALKVAPGSLRAHLLLGQLLEEAGDFDGARAQYAVFEPHLKTWESPGPEKAYNSVEDVIAVGRGLDRWATLTDKYRDNAALSRTILSVFTRAYDVIDSGNPEAHVAAAEYLMAHDDPQQAAEEIKAALKVNPRLAAAHALLAEIALSQFNFDAADARIASLRELDPNSPEALLLEARNLLAQRQAQLAEPILERIVHGRPADLRALGLLAAAHAIRLDDAGEKATLARADAIAPLSAGAYYELAEQLSALRQYDRADATYRVALAREPWSADARNGLGLLQMQSGDEEGARVTLEEARHVDPFNARTTNYMRLLDKLGAMARLESPHFTVRFDRDADPFIAQMIIETLEPVHEELTAYFRHAPAAKTMIEVFPTHAEFSVRTAGIPFIGTVGASTGRVIALVAPRDGRATLGTYDWAQVLRHEYTHTITLSQTDNRIPHWMTEGLAVVSERTPMRWEWAPMLYSAVTKDELFSMDGVTWGFVRPRRPIDRQLAYAQSAWMCEYIAEKYGQAAILSLLAAFKAGLTQDQAFQRVLHVSQSEFHAEFVTYAKARVATWGYDKETQSKYDALREQADQNVQLRHYPQALEQWLAIEKLRPIDALPHQRLAGLYLTKEINQPSEAIKHLALLSSVEIKDDRYAKRLAKLADQTGDLPAAIGFARHATHVSSYDEDAHKLLLTLLKKSTLPADVAAAAEEEKIIGMLDALEEKRREDGETPKDAQAKPVEPG